MKKFTLYFECKSDAKLMAEYLTNIKADCKFKIKSLFMTNTTLIKVSSKLSEREFKTLYNI